jgi:phage terminase large subunit-like protein
VRRAQDKYTEVAQQYARGVVAGEIPACEVVKAVCKRALADWERKNWIYTYSPDEAARVCRFIELLPHIKGPLAGQPIKLEPWQIFILSQIFGWLKADGTRRYRRAYIEIPRGNAKSTMSAAVALYMLCADGESGAEVYSFATTRDQARIVFDTAREMARRSPELQAAYGLVVEKHNLHIVESASKFEPKSSDADTLDGLNTHFACIDELHAHRTRDVYDVVETSLGKRTNNLLWCITTAGSDQAGVCYELHRHVIHQTKSEPDEHDAFFGIIYTVDA